jgi:hydrogenase-4 component B
MPTWTGLWCVAALFLIAIGGIGFGRYRFGTPLIYGTSLIVCAVATTAALMRLLAVVPPAELTLPLGLPWMGAHFRLDGLTTFFQIVINLGGAITSLYALGYGRHEQSPLRVLPFYPAFLAAMNLVVVADDAFTFLLSWELMSLVTWAIVIARDRNPANLRAGYLYLLMASFGTLCLLLAFGVLAGPGDTYAFAGIRGVAHPPMAEAIAVVLAVLGAGSKAGLVPLHVWLPLAHPAAPSHVSALLSGVMTKIGVYAFIRIVFDLVGDATAWSALLVLALGAITAALGVLYALMQHDLKRLLAYSTVENIGIVFVGLGLALGFKSNGMMLPAALALTAALFHVLNHSLFKSLLFFSAGAVLVATEETSLERLGGLIHRMPQTALVYLIGCASISALPPLNGFVSEWLTFQAILVSPQMPHWGLKFMIPTVGALLALSAALAGACFVKAYGLSFLGRPRSRAAEGAGEADDFSLAAMFILAALCVLAGALPGFVIDALSPIVQTVIGGAMPHQASEPWLSIVPIAESRSSYNGLIILVFLLCSGSLTAAIIHRFATRAVRRAPIWDCGFPLTSPQTQYTSSSFAQPIRRVFGAVVFGVYERLDMPAPGDMRIGHFQTRLADPAWRLIYGPIARRVTRIAGRLNRLQFLTIRNYLSLVFAALLMLLLVVAAWR